MKILIVTQYFPPRNEIAAVRMANLAAGLAGLGWEVEVVTMEANRCNPLERNGDFGEVPEGLSEIRVITVGSPWLAKSLYAVRALGSRVLSVSRRQKLGGSDSPMPVPTGEVGPHGRNFLSRLKVVAKSAVDRSTSAALVRGARRARDIDVIWCSYGPSHMAAVGPAVADAHPSARFVMDIRDPIVRGGEVAAHYVAVDAERRRRDEAAILSRADGLSLVANELIDPARREGVPAVLVPNGFDPRDVRGEGSPRSPHGTSILRLYYGGRLYPMQQLDGLVGACARLDDVLDVEVHYAGPDAEAFLASFARAGLGGMVVNHGFVSRQRSQELALECDVAVVLSWNNSERGVMTGKVYELLALNRPLVVLIAGNAEDSALAEMMADDPVRRVFDASLPSANEIAEYLCGLSANGYQVPPDQLGASRYRHVSYAARALVLDEFLRKICG